MPSIFSSKELPNNNNNNNNNNYYYNYNNNYYNNYNYNSATEVWKGSSIHKI